MLEDQQSEIDVHCFHLICSLTKARFCFWLGYANLIKITPPAYHQNHWDKLLLNHWASKEIIWVNFIIKTQIWRQLSRTSWTNFYMICKSLIRFHVLWDKCLFLRGVLIVRKAFLSLHWFGFQHSLFLPPSGTYWCTKYKHYFLQLLLGKMWISKFSI